MKRRVLSHKSRKLLDLFGLKYPIFQAAPGGEQLALAVARAGGMGALGLSWTSRDEAVKSVKRLKTQIGNAFYANYVLHFPPATLNAVLNAGCPCIQFSWGMPSHEMVADIRRAGAHLAIQVSSVKSAVRALEFNPDFLICQA